MPESVIAESFRQILTKIGVPLLEGCPSSVTLHTETNFRGNRKRRNLYNRDFIYTAWTKQ